MTQTSCVPAIALLALAACASESTGPEAAAGPSARALSIATSSVVGSLAADGAAASWAQAGAPVAASGRVDIHGTPVQNVKDQTYSFTAMASGSVESAQGQVQVDFVRFTGEQVQVHAEVTCLAVRDNQAWVGARVTRFVMDGEEVPVLRPMIFRVQDAGEGAGVKDLASLVFFPAPGGDLTHCNTRPAFPIMRESEGGNLQVSGN